MVDPSEDVEGIASPGQSKDKTKDKDKKKDEDKGGGPGKGKQAPSAGSKGINPVQHSE
ncbi:MAG TPA: hypothetical protein VK422_04240 [Pyrinomonadaceae bacterium]|nr:hypothetical protein [Pyrinomonadaceae bacterium]